MAYERFAYIYDRLMQDMPYDAWLRFMEEAWGRWGRPQTIVELGCGTGNLTIPLAQRGLHITGIDLSEEMLAVAMSKSDTAALNSSDSINWIHQDMCEWVLPAPVDAVISFCDSLNYLLEESDVRQVLHSTYQGLKSGGLFMFDVHTETRFRTYALEQPYILDEEEIAYLWSIDWEEEDGILTHDLAIFIKESMETSPNRPLISNNNTLYRRIDETQQQRAYPLEWWNEQLTQSGFALLGCFADFSFAPADEDTDRAFFVAQKTE
ncbi:class I SAM-dependent DNA methyltransferase [Paenibacillus senegalensis]|uniref:class I SAM-dependent DNA methyltransferase n=1 Tax=Paenibacillus senegalensis TaxID=1465766 RepID=UPI0002891ABD|nr:class I SAM-dependent methyltransferase [Paenibacillus senegalensis]